jgi:hypothetical protein
MVSFVRNNENLALQGASLLEGRCQGARGIALSGERTFFP